MVYGNSSASILRYIIERQVQPGERLPTIAELSQELGVSVSKIREELEVARTLGLVQIKPRTGSQVQPFDFAPAATLSVLYAIGLDRAYFHAFSDLRNQVEVGFWAEAVRQLTQDDICLLRQLVAGANEKLNRIPIEVPVAEHRRLHLTFFKHLENPFVQGLLKAYWAAYQAFGVALHAPLSYHREVWAYHEQMVECVARGDIEGSRRALQEHMTLLRHEQEHLAEPGDGAAGSANPAHYIYSIFE